MQTNVGSVDRAIRIIVGLVLILAPFANILNMGSSVALTYGSILVGAVLVATAAFKVCPLYSLLGISTCRT